MKAKLSLGPWMVSVSIAILACAMQPWVNMLSWNRFAIMHGQFWRLITGVLVHGNWTHNLINLLALATLTWLFGLLFDWKTWLRLLLVLTLSVNVALLWISSTVDYVGLSGVLHGVFIYCVCQQFSKRPIESSILLVGLFIKLILEWHYPTGLGDQAFIDMPVATNIHRLFITVSLGLLLLEHGWNKWKANRDRLA